MAEIGTLICYLQIQCNQKLEMQLAIARNY